MKKLLLACLLLSATTGYAQIQVGSRAIPSMNIAGKIGKTEMVDFKKSTTIFTLQFKDFDHIEDFQKAIAKVWTVTPFKIVKPDEIGNYMKEGYSIFMYGSIVAMKNGQVVSTHLYDELWLPHVKKNGKVKKEFLARITLFPDFDAMKEGSRGFGMFDGKARREKENYLYNDAHFYNWNAGFLMGYLKTVNDGLANWEGRGPFSEMTDKAAMAQLKTDTLYIPDYIFTKFNMFTGAEKENDDHSDSDLKDYYPYPIKVLPAEELSQMILNSKKPIKYLTYIKSSTDKFLNIFDSQTEKMIFSRYIKVSYNFKSKDMKRIAKEIE